MSKKKNLMLAIALTITFGALGLLYASFTAGRNAIIFIIFVVIPLIITSTLKLDFLTTTLYLNIKPIIVVWGVLIVQEKNALLDMGQPIDSRLDTRTFFDTVQIYLVSLAFCFIILAMLTYFNENNFLQNNMLLLGGLLWFFMILIALGTKKQAHQ